MSRKMPENDVEGIKDPTCWPNFPILPVKEKCASPTSDINVGILLHPPTLKALAVHSPIVEYNPEAPYTVFRLNMFMLSGETVDEVVSALTKADRIDFVSPEALCEKWWVD